jgi:deoxyribonuclease-4
MSTAGGVSKAFDRAESVGCDTMQIFTRNNNRWATKPIDEEEIFRWRARWQRSNVNPIISHASYLINLASSDEMLWQKSIEAFVDELERAEALGLMGVVLHPGSPKHDGEAYGIARIAQALDICHQRTDGYKTLTLLETTAGTGNHLGYRFEQLGAMRSAVSSPERIAICFDTCHVFAAGYEIRTPGGYAETMDAFERHIGLHLLRCFHFNDSKFDLGARKDRHAHIGKGYIGLDGFRHIINDPRFQQTPMILETPKSKDLHEDAENLAILRSLVEQ